MSAFQFPDPSLQQEVTNDNTGITYRWDASTQSWVAVATSVADSFATQIELDAEIQLRESGDKSLQDDLADLTEQVEALENAPAPSELTYQIGTNVLSGSDSPAIELVDSEGSSSNVTFEATGGLTVTSNASSIIFDGSEINSGTDVNLDDYYTKTEVDEADTYLQDQINELLTTKGAASVYTLNDIGIVVGIRPGDFYIDNTVAKDVSFITLAPVDDNGNERPLGAVGDILELVKSDNTAYRYEITTAGEGVAGVQFQVAADPDDLLIPGMTFSVYIYPQNKASASIEYVDTRHEEAKAYTNSVANDYLPLAGGEMTGSLNMKGAAINTNALVKSTRTSGYAFQVYDEANDSNPAFIHSNGNGRFAQGTFTDSVEIRGTTTLKSDLHLEANLSSTAHFFTKGGSFRIDKADGSKQFQIYPNGGDGFGATLYTYNNGFFKVRIAEGDAQSPYKEFINCQAGDNIVGGVTHPVSTQINWLKTPTSNHHAANKQYVDDMGQIYYGNIVPAGSDVNDGDLWVDSGNMRLLMRASGAWVNPDRESDASEFRKYIAPNGRKFGFSSGTGTVTGKLNYYDSGGLKLRLSNTDAWGVKWNDGGIRQDVTMSSGPYFTIWEWLNDSNHKMIRQGRVSRIDYHDSDILCYLSSHRTNGSFSTSKNYWVTIGGII